MRSLIENCPIWSSFTYKEQLMEIKDIIPYFVFETLYNQLEVLQIANSKVDGFSSENLPKSEEASGVNISYSETFHDLYNEQFTPTLFLAKLTEKFLNKNYNLNKLTGFLARGIRTLTSLIREPDFALKLKTELAKYGNVNTDLNSKQDSADHTDVLLKFREKEYRIWLYQLSSRGLPHDIERVSGKRGELPIGIHILCPLRTDLAINYITLLNRYSNCIHKKNSKENQFMTVSERAVIKRSNLRLEINTLEKQINDIEIKLSKSKIEISEEIEIVNGWFFYSFKYIQKLSELLISEEVIPDKYEFVKQTMNAPVEYVSKISFFEK